MSHKTGKTGDVGEQLVLLRLRTLLDWISRKDSPDGGFDSNVEIEESESQPGRRFLTQVKTALSQKPAKDGSWRLAVGANALARYRKSRLPVFLFGVDIKSEEIRWVDLSEVLRGNALRGPFALRITNQLDATCVDALRRAVDKAFEDKDEEFAPAEVSLARQKARLQAMDPNLEIGIDLVGGKRRIHYRSIDGSPVRFKATPEDADDQKLLADSYNFGVEAKIRVSKFVVQGSPALAHIPAAGSLTIRPHERKIRVRLRLKNNSPKSKPVVIELDAATAGGAKGWNIRSIDDGSVFSFSIRSTFDGSSLEFVPGFSIERWNGMPLTKLPMLEIGYKLAHCFTLNGEMDFESYHDGKWLILFKLKYEQQSEFHSIAESFAFYKRLAHVCQFYDVPELLWHRPHISRVQAEAIDLAYTLCTEDSVETLPHPMQMEESPSLYSAYQSKTGTPFPGTLRAPLHLRLGEIHIADVPVEIEVDSLLLERGSKGILIKAAPGAKGTMRRDRQTPEALPRSATK